MEEIRLVAAEALKLVYSGTIKEYFCDWLVWYTNPNAYKGDGDPLKYTWGTDTLGALFLAYIKIKGPIQCNDTSGNFWTPSLIESKLKEIEYFKNPSMAGRFNRVKALESLPCSTYTPNIEEQNFKDNCTYKVRYMLTKLMKDGNISCLDWSSKK